MKKVRFECHECFSFQMPLMLISIPRCDNKCSTTSVWPSNAAQINAVKLNVRVKFHKYSKFEIL